MPNLTGMSLLKRIEWKVFLLQALKGDGVGGVGAKEKVASVKRPQKEASKGKTKRSQFKEEEEEGSVKFQLCFRVPKLL